MIGQQLGPYEVLEKIGEGGMGEVYRARDTRLDREVAIKVLPERRLDSADARARFEREAQAVAALSHPNILAIHDVGEFEGGAYAVTELLEGQSLQDELKLGAIPLRRAIDLASQMAEGLAAAHEKGIVHRDLKPANVFLAPDGRLKILDFGLAKATPLSEVNSMTATMQDGTAPGTVLGTVRYMSPEQVRGAEVDARSDIFSFGTVLWEMLSGEIAFQRDSAVEIMNAIIKEDPPDLSGRSGTIPAGVERIVRRCLEKAPERRFQSAQDLSFALRNALDSTSRGLPALDAPAPDRRPGLRTAAAAVALLALGWLGGTFTGQRLGSAPVPEPVKITPLTHSGTDSGPTASPDGRMIAFVSERDGRARIWLRQMQGGIEVPLTEGPDRAPRFAPDGSSILFFRSIETRLSAWRVPVVGGTSRRIIDDVSDACWSPDGNELAFIRIHGTAAEPVCALSIRNLQTGDDRELRRWDGRFVYGLDWSPDGRWLAALESAPSQNTGTALVRVDVVTGEIASRRDEPVQYSAPTWTPDGRALIFARSGSLLGDISGSVGRVLRYDPFDGAETTSFWVQSVWAGANDYVRFDFLDANRIVFDEILWQGSLTAASIDGEADGRPERALTTGNSRDRQPAYSPDGRSVAFSSNRSGNADIWTLDVASGELRQVTDDAAEDWDPAFGPDGRSILWSSNRGGHLEIWTARADGSGARQVSSDGVDAENPTQTRDGQWIVYGSGNPADPGVWRVRPDGSDATQIVRGTFFLPEVSPDGRYVSFVGNDPERQVVQIQIAEVQTGEIVFGTEVPFRGFQNTIQPGRARWMPDGDTLVFVGPDADDHYSLYAQAFRPGEDTSSTRRLLLEADGAADIESFGISPDGGEVTFARISHFRTLKLAEGDFGFSR